MASLTRPRQTTLARVDFATSRVERALDLPGMGYSQIVPGASYEESSMRAAVVNLIRRLDLRDVTLLGESMGAVLALTTAAVLPERVRRVLAINPYDYAGGSEETMRRSFLRLLEVTPQDYRTRFRS